MADDRPPTKPPRNVAYFFDEELCNYNYGGGNPMRPHRHRLTTNLVRGGSGGTPVCHLLLLLCCRCSLLAAVPRAALLSPRIHGWMLIACAAHALPGSAAR